MSKYIPEWATHYRIKNNKPLLNCVTIEFFNHGACVHKPIEELEKDLAVADVLAQIREKAPVETTANVESIVGPIKQERYKASKETTEDHIDHMYNQMTFEQFVGAIWFTMAKYLCRLGKKDDIEAEAYKVKDYANRFYEKVLVEKAKRIDEKV